ncbi:DUF1569 domain-containing protein [Flavobacterium restrictum]|uniref:DUF1569 domain-containing protein n=1 Tax=Flavobacterium restrictum TaxID=2594428 RepID=A0A553E8Z0_9FLAO|nr:DUF1569 domain-containing protein [Flavobacterium restrictum]TRX41460.1 DUF1569 domain-containing protein [Flavobacterium restrictum]
MSSIYNKTDNAKIIARIHSLTPESKAIWGKMNAAQMCKHCTLASDLAFGKIDIKINFLMKLLGKILKKKVLYGGEMGKSSPTAKEFISTTNEALEKTKLEFIANISRFATEGKTAITVMDHPFWGKMTYEDWDALMWKHADHHLRQFGV